MTTGTAQKVLWSRLFMFTFVLAGTLQIVHADELARVLDPDAHRSVIQESRRTETQRLDGLANDCERKFAVSRCLEQVHHERLKAEGKLNRQEAVLNDKQRVKRGREQEERNREKAVAHAEKMAKVARETTTGAKQPRLVATPTAPARQGFPSAAKEPFLSVQERSANATAYERKQTDAIAKRAEVAKRLRDAGAKKPSLPKPD